jgi:hypothetical protein
MALPLLALAGIGAAIGLGKNLLVDKPEAKRRRLLEAETARNSAWTGLRPNMGNVEDPNPFGAMMQGATTGLGMGQNMAAAAPADDVSTALAQYESGGQQQASPASPLYNPLASAMAPGSPQAADHEMKQLDGAWSGMRRRLFEGRDE